MKKLIKKKVKKTKNNNYLNNNIKLYKLFLKNKNHIGPNNKNIKNSDFLYGIRFNHAILDITYTITLLKRCFSFIKLAINNKKKIIIIGNSYTIKHLLRKIKKKYLFSKYFIFINNKLVKNFFREIPESEINEISLIIFFNLQENKNILKETNNKNIPTVSLIDNNNNLNINYPIYTNTQNVNSLHFMIFLFECFFKKLV